MVGSLTLLPFTSKILVDNGLAPLTLLSIAPALIDVDDTADFTLSVIGYSFTPGSVVRWNGSSRPTTYLSDTHLTAAISAADVSALGEYPVTVYDPNPLPSGTLTTPIPFHVVDSVFTVYLPAVNR